MSGQRTIVPLSFSPSNADAAFVMETLQQRGIGAGQRSAVMWALMAAQLRGVVTGELFAAVEAHPDARFVMHQLAARGIPENERADVLWAMLAAYLRGEVIAQLPQEDVIDVAEIARLMDEW